MLLVALGGTGAARGRKLYPVDEGAQDRSFSVFREKLRRAVRRKDIKFVLSILDPKIELSFGGHQGVEDFKTLWLSRNAEDLWEELGAVLALGGTFETRDGGKEFCAPYTFTRFPHDLDAFEYGAVIGKDVRVRARPATTAPVIELLSYDIVRAVYFVDASNQQDDVPGWVRVTTPSGKKGYVAEKYIRSPVDYRACFRKVKRKWWMTLFIGGD